MDKTVILITGTPCVGKTIASRLLLKKLDALYVNLTELARSEGLVLGKDDERDSLIVDEARMKQRIEKMIEQSGKANIVVDGHYAVNVVPPKLVTRVFVLRRDPVELRMLMRRVGFPERKSRENLASEILDICLVDSINVVGKEKVCEINVTGKRADEVVQELLLLLSNPEKCCVGIVDWLGKLEKEGLLDEYINS